MSGAKEWQQNTGTVLLEASGGIWWATVRDALDSTFATVLDWCKSVALAQCRYRIVLTDMRSFSFNFEKQFDWLLFINQSLSLSSSQ